MTKALRKTIMMRSRFKNIYNKNGLITIGINIKNKGIFAWNSLAKQSRITSMTLILEVTVILKSSGKLLNLISVTED